MAKADPKDDDLLSERVIIPLTKAMVGAIKDHWHSHQLNSKAEAVRDLIQLGLDAASRKGSRR